MSIKKELERKGVVFSVHKLTNMYIYNDGNNKRVDLFYTPYPSEEAKEKGYAYEPVHVHLQTIETNEEGEEIVNEELVELIDKVLSIGYAEFTIFTDYKDGEKI